MMSEEPVSAERTKLDLKKDLKHLYTPPTQEVVVVEVPSMNFLMLDGKGNPNTAQEYQDAVEALYSVAYTLKFMLKKDASIEYAVMPLEGLWWADGGRNAPKESWQWTMMIMQPDCVTGKRFAKALEQVRQKKNLSALDKLRLESLHEGLSAQIMHVGPFAAEGPTLEKIERYIDDHKYVAQGKHHEIYLNDPRKTATEKMRTVLRHPVRLFN